MDSTVLTIVGILLTSLLGGAAASIGWAFKRINKVDTSTEVLSTRIDSTQTDIKTLESVKDRVVVLETLQKVAKDEVSDIKSDVRGIRKDIEEANKEHSNTMIGILEQISQVNQNVVLIKSDLDRIEKR